MAEGDRPRDPAAPLPVQPQHTAPLGQPWSLPHFQQPGPVVDLRKSSTWAEVLKTAIAVVGLLLSAGGIVFAGGQLVGEFKSFKAEVRSDVSDLREQVKKTAADSAAGNAAIAGQVKELNTKIGRLNLTRRNRSHGSAEDAPLPPTP